MFDFDLSVIASVLFNFILLPTALAGPFLLFGLAAQSIVFQKNLSSKLAAQIAPLLCVLFCLSYLPFIADLAQTTFLLWQEKNNVPFSADILSRFSCSTALPLIMLLLTIAWKSWRKKPFLHCCLLLLSACLNFSLLLINSMRSAIIFAEASFAAGKHPAILLTGQNSLFFLLSSWLENRTEWMHSWISPLLASLWLFSAGLGLCAGFSTLWLITRREKDQFGRDYYAFAFRNLSKWATTAAFTVGTLFTAIISSSQGQYSLLSGMPATACAATLLAGLAWLGLARSVAPLRWTFVQPIALSLFATGLFAQITLILS